LWRFICIESQQVFMACPGGDAQFRETRKQNGELKNVNGGLVHIRSCGQHLTFNGRTQTVANTPNKSLQARHIHITSSPMPLM
jgi:hypothetical protein